MRWQLASLVSDPRDSKLKDAFNDQISRATWHHFHRMFLHTQLSLFNIGRKNTKVWTPGGEGPMWPPGRMPGTHVSCPSLSRGRADIVTVRRTGRGTCNVLQEFPGAGVGEITSGGTNPCSPPSRSSPPALSPFTQLCSLYLWDPSPGAD